VIAADEPEMQEHQGQFHASMLAIAAIVFTAILLKKQPLSHEMAEGPLSGAGTPEDPRDASAHVAKQVRLEAIGIFVAVIALIVTSFINWMQLEASRAHQELSVTPHLDIHASNVLEAPKLILENPANLDIYIFLENNGVGPAVIDKVVLREPVSNREYKDIQEWISKNEINYGFLRWRTPAPDQYIKEGRDFELMRVINYQDLRRLPVKDKEEVVSNINNALSRLEIVVVYHSIYNIPAKDLRWRPVSQGAISPRVMDSIMRAREP
jgi:hypothetical protein